METELSLNLETPAVAPENSDARWVAWGLWSFISLAMVLFAIFALGIDTGLLLGWVVGTIVAATITLFGRK